MAEVALRTGLVAHWSMDDSNPHTQLDSSGNERHLVKETDTITPKAGVVNGAINLRSNGEMDYAHDQVLNFVGTSFTAAFWMRVPTTSLVSTPALQISKANLAVHAGWFIEASLVSIPTRTYQATFSIDPTGAPATVNSVAFNNSEWVFVTAWFDVDTQTIAIAINAGDPVVGPGPVAFPNQAQPFRVFGNNGDVDELSLWDRLLNEDEIAALYNNGDGLAFADWPTVLADDCQSIPCCDEDLFAYSSANATDSGCASGFDECIETPTIQFIPPVGSAVAFPTYVILIASDPEATIYLTRDGTTPNAGSGVYSGPELVTGPTDIIKAIAIVEGCPTGPVASAVYRNPVSPISAMQLRYRCDTPDHGGIWGEFSANGEPDYHWSLDLTLTENLAIRRLELYEVNSLGEWDTGQAWATRQYNDPIEGPANFNTYPLIVFRGLTQLNVACGSEPCGYTDDFSTDYGPVPAGQEMLDLYGQTRIQLAGSFFKLLVVTNTETVYTIISSTVCDPPETIITCPPTPDPDVEGTCTGIDILYTLPPGTPYRIYRYSPDCGPSTPIIITSGTAGGGSGVVSPVTGEGGEIITGEGGEQIMDEGTGESTSFSEQVLGEGGEEVTGEGGEGVLGEGGEIMVETGVYHDTSAIVGCTYCYFLSAQIEGCDRYVDSNPVCAERLTLPSVSISVSEESVCTGSSFTLSWNSSNIAAGGDCGSSDVTITPDVGVRPGNVAGSVSITPAVDTTYTISGCNPCGTAMASVDVVIISGPDCPPNVPNSVRILDYNESDPNGVHFVCNGVTFTLSFFGFTGTIPRFGPPGTCDYQWTSGGGFNSINLTYLGDCQWEFIFEFRCFGESTQVFRAVKTGSQSPLGTYTNLITNNTCCQDTAPFVGPTSLTLI